MSKTGLGNNHMDVCSFTFIIIIFLGLFIFFTQFFVQGRGAGGSGHRSFTEPHRNKIQL